MSRRRHLPLTLPTIQVPTIVNQPTELPTVGAPNTRDTVSPLGVVDPVNTPTLPCSIQKQTGVLPQTTTVTTEATCVQSHGPGGTTMDLLPGGIQEQTGVLPQTTAIVTETTCVQPHGPVVATVDHMDVGVRQTVEGLLQQQMVQF